jgi:putative transposase
MHLAGHSAVAAGRRTTDSAVYVGHYKNVRPHSAIGYVTPLDILAGRRKEIQAARDRKLEKARQKRQLRRRAAA